MTWDQERIDTEREDQRNHEPKGHQRIQRVVLDISYDDRIEDSPSLWAWGAGVTIDGGKVTLLEHESPRADDTLLDGLPL